MKNLAELLVENGNLRNERTAVISKGLDMNCYPVVHKSVLFFDESWYMEDDDFSIKIPESELESIYLDTKENRKELKGTF